MRKAVEKLGINKEKLRKLKQEADKAFNAKQQAYEIRKTSFDKLVILMRDYNDKLWENYKQYCKENSTAIESNRKKADEEHKEMVKAFEDAHQKYEEGDGALAKGLSNEGYDHQAKRDRLNELVQKLCQEKSAKKTYVEKHELPRKISELLKMDSKSLQELIPQADVLKRFIVELEDARFKDREFRRLEAEYKEKQAEYQCYKQYGDDPALNDVKKSSGNWEPLIRGWIDDHPVTLRVGQARTDNEGNIINDTEGDTLIADGHVSRAQFDKKHNHYGDNRKPDIKEKRIEDVDGDRGAYTGPGC